MSFISKQAYIFAKKLMLDFFPNVLKIFIWSDADASLFHLLTYRIYLFYVHYVSAIYVRLKKPHVSNNIERYKNNHSSLDLFLHLQFVLIDPRHPSLESQTFIYGMKLKLRPVAVLDKKEMIDGIITMVTWLICKWITRKKYFRQIHLSKLMILPINFICQEVSQV